ncbi:MAG TPA: aldose epimerase family protein [Opitutaceae bacterium]|jgi:aldose 1-epimerase|nr:aldose epimerase family protein [Opitutaceae bacterium]
MILPLLASIAVTSFGPGVQQYALTNSHGVTVKVMTYGATITEVDTPDRNGQIGDIVLGFDNVQGYKDNPKFFGATVGRVANRIAKGHFELDGHDYTLATNDGPNTLHGGLHGWNTYIWKAHRKGSSSVEMSRVSPDGEEGFPGTVHASVRFTLDDSNRLRIDYRATTDRDTPINLTNHSYWNLSGYGSVLQDRLMVDASRYTPVDSTLIPTGVLAPVAGTDMDFRKPRVISHGGYDHNFVLDHPGDLSAVAAQVTDPHSGRVLTVYTDQPGLQVYTGNFLDGTITGRGHPFTQYGAICLETQHFPDSINEPSFPSTVLHPHEVYRTTTIYAFSTE